MQHGADRDASRVQVSRRAAPVRDNSALPRLRVLRRGPGSRVRAAAEIRLRQAPNDAKLMTREYAVHLLSNVLRDVRGPCLNRDAWITHGRMLFAWIQLHDALER